MCHWNYRKTVRSFWMKLFFFCYILFYIDERECVVGCIYNEIIRPVDNTRKRRAVLRQSVILNVIKSIHNITYRLSISLFIYYSIWWLYLFGFRLTSAQNLLVARLFVNWTFFPLKSKMSDLLLVAVCDGANSLILLFLCWSTYSFYLIFLNPFFSSRSSLPIFPCRT